MGSEGSERRDWKADAQSALDDVTTSVQAAWEGSREARTEAMGAAKAALEALGSVLDQASTSAKQAWGSGDDTPTPPAPAPAGSPAPDTTDPVAPTASAAPSAPATPSDPAPTAPGDTEA